MPKVLIDGIEYVAMANIPPLEMDNDRLLNALKELVSLYCFGDWHKAQCRIWDAICHISPELAELVSNDPREAYALLGRTLNEPVD